MGRLPCKGLRSRAPPAADTARRSRCSGRRAQVCFSARSAMRAPQTGRWMRRKAQTEGCIAAWRQKMSCKARQDLALCFVGDDVCIVPQTLRCRKAPRRPGRILARQGTAPLSRLTRQLPLQGSLPGGSSPKASPARSCGVERRLRRRKLFLMQQTAVTPFIIACSAIESIRSPYLRPKSRACGPVGLRNSACGR